MLRSLNNLFCGKFLCTSSATECCLCFSCFPQVIEAIQGVDKIIGQLMNGLKQIGLHQCLNIIIVADHGETHHIVTWLWKQFCLSGALFETNGLQGNH